LLFLATPRVSQNKIIFELATLGHRGLPACRV
jgi:hypothetical protein